MSEQQESTRRVRATAAGVVVLAVLAGTMATGGATEASPRSAAPAAPPSEPLDDAGTVGAPSAKLLGVGTGDEPETFLIRLRGDAVPSYTGSIRGLPRTAPRPGRQLNPESAPARAYRDHLVEEQGGFVERIERRLGHDVEVPFTYQFAVNGIAAVLTPDEARVIAKDPAVVSVSPDEERQLHTDAGPQWQNADALWNAMAELGLPTDIKGEGIVIGTIDTGISPGNRSFADPAPGDGYDHTNPLGEGNYLGVCNPANPQLSGGFDPHFPCNDKLIGAYVFRLLNRNSAVDYDGHGSHTASTSGGNVVNDVIASSPTITTQPFDISGVAPHANVISYLGCCSTSGLAAAIDQAIADQVDVINYSIGSDLPVDPWEDFDSVGFLNARAAGIFVATSNGNAGPGSATTGSPSNAPWLTTVGASTHNRHNGNVLTGLTSSAGTLPDIHGKSVTGSLPPTPIIYAGDVDDPLCLDDEGHEAEFTGKIVICDRGRNGRVEKSFNVAAQGAAGFVLVNDEVNGDSLLGDEYAVPGVFIAFDDGQVLKDWLDEGSDHMAGVRGTIFTIEDDRGDIMASFSSRGPNRSVDTIVPSVTAPGVDILAAVGADSYTADVHGFISGTSMSSPHVAGAAALLTQARPNWTPAQMQSALMTTARPTVLNHDGEPATPYAQGSGHIDVGAATRAGLLFDETVLRYLDANPEEGGDPKTLNLPSFADSQCLATCSWTRTATVPMNADAPVPANVTWTASAVSDTGLTLDVSLSPATVSPGDSMTIDVTADVTGAPTEETRFGRITLTPDHPDVPAVTMPVAVHRPPGNLPVEELDISTRRNVGSHPIAGLEAADPSSFSGSVTDVVQAVQVTGSLLEDPTRSDAFDDLDDVAVHPIDIPAGTARLVVEVLDTSSPDVDLFVGTGTTPNEDTVECFSAAFSSDEKCIVEQPAPGQWWVVLQNWEASGPGPDDYVLSTTPVPASGAADNVGIAGPPAAVPPGEPFEARLHWSIPEMEAGDTWYGMAVFSSSPASPGDIGSVPVTIRRHDDDVAKTASVDTALPGDTIHYELTVRPNVTAEDRTYTITDTVPAGLTIDPSSVTGGVVDGQTVTWEIESPSLATASGEYVASTPATNPQCGTKFADLSAVPFVPDLDGDGSYAILLSGTGLTFDVYGQETPGLVVSDDGLITTVGSYGGDPKTPQALPSPARPNGVIAPLWSDLELSVADGRGVHWILTGNSDAVIVQWDDPFVATADDTVGPSVGTFQAWIYREVDDSRPEIRFEYPDLGALPATATIGVENRLGTAATTLLSAGDPNSALEEGATICFDYVPPSVSTVTVGYDVTVDAGAAPGTYRNDSVHVTDDPFGAPATASADVEVFLPVAPAAPGSPNATPGDRSVRLSWSPPAASGGPAPTDYVIERSTSASGPWTLIDDGVSTATSFTAIGLANGTGYFFRVAAVNEFGTGPFSAVASATPRTVPSRPLSLAASPRSRAVRLSWAPPASDGGSPITDYVIQRATTRTGPWRTLADGVSTARSFTAKRLTNGRRSFFRVAARTAAGLGPFSPVVAATPRTVPSRPLRPSASPRRRAVRLAWARPASNGGAAITDYVIQRAARRGGPWRTVRDGVSTARRHVVTGLPNGRRQFFRIAAVNPAGRGRFSVVVAATPHR